MNNKPIKITISEDRIRAIIEGIFDPKSDERAGDRMAKYMVSLFDVREEEYITKGTEYEHRLYTSEEEAIADARRLAQSHNDPTGRRLYIAFVVLVEFFTKTNVRTGRTVVEYRISSLDERQTKSFLRYSPYRHTRFDEYTE